MRSSGGNDTVKDNGSGNDKENNTDNHSDSGNKHNTDNDTCPSEWPIQILLSMITTIKMSST